MTSRTGDAARQLQRLYRLRNGSRDWAVLVKAVFCEAFTCRRTASSINISASTISAKLLIAGIGAAFNGFILTLSGASAKPRALATSILTSSRNVPVQPGGSEKLRFDGGGPLKAHTPGDSSVPALKTLPAGNPPSTTRSIAPPEPAIPKGRGVWMSTDETSSSGRRRAALLGPLLSISGLPTGAGAFTEVSAPFSA